MFLKQIFKFSLCFSCSCLDPHDFLTLVFYISARILSCLLCDYKAWSVSSDWNISKTTFKCFIKCFFFRSSLYKIFVIHQSECPLFIFQCEGCCTWCFCTSPTCVEKITNYLKNELWYNITETITNMATLSVITNKIVDHTIMTIMSIKIYLASPYLATSSNLSLLQVTIAQATSLKIIDINLLDVKQPAIRTVVKSTWGGRAGCKGSLGVGADWAGGQKPDDEH